MDTEDKGGQWIQGNSRYSGYRRRVERIQADSGYRGYRWTVDTEDTGGQWIQRIQADSGYRETVGIVDALLKISDFSADPCTNSNINNEDPHFKNR